jgi:hypothetical protein
MEINFSQGSKLLKWGSNYIRGLIYFSGGQILLMRVKFTLLWGQYYFNGGQILLGIKNTSIRGQKNFK